MKTTERSFITNLQLKQKLKHDNQFKFTLFIIIITDKATCVMWHASCDSPVTRLPCCTQRGRTQTPGRSRSAPWCQEDCTGDSCHAPAPCQHGALPSQHTDSSTTQWYTIYHHVSMEPCPVSILTRLQYNGTPFTTMSAWSPAQSAYWLIYNTMVHHLPPCQRGAP